ncbi:hypothetical protein SLS53_009376 [Cytospora paraplurivora]|uniref:Glucose-methanol-choline oxidoreductase N-terminal domain-containing protein n=1 Tax=Cytospora paraplurivora TaxID=2898453 RepID=A0AAN9TZ18_9PEZI
MLLFFAIQLHAAKFDYVIIGGGTCGLLLANRLSEDSNTTIAVIEPGQDVRNSPNVTDPENFLASFNTPIDWAYPSVVQPGAANRSFTFHSGRAIGGTSTINGMTYIRADAAEIDAWEALGNEGWNWEALFPYYKKVERFTRPTMAQVAAGASYEPKYHGQDGELHVGFRYALANGSFEEIAQEGWQALGSPVNPDVNDGDTRGFNVWPQTVDRESDLRWDAARAFYYPVQHRTNLSILNGTAIRLVWSTTKDGSRRKKATGVEYTNTKNETIVATIGKEAVLSAGSLRTPLLLELSGIGNPQILESLGVDTIIDLAGVGENLQEQPNNDILFSGALNVTGSTTYATFGTAEDIYGHNKGSVHLRSVHQVDQPVIDPRYFLADIDLVTQIAIGKHAQAFWNTSCVEGHTKLSSNRNSFHDG